MATTEELLEQLEAEAQSETSVCIIDPDTRTITVPPEYQLLGVENDKRVERLYFQCPKIVGDNQDLSQDYILFINYVNANGDPDAYKIEDMQVDGDNITFSWLLEEKVTLYQGDIQISFCGIIPGDEQEDPDKNRWGTTINTDCTVLTGLKCTQQVAESNPDALVQIWAAIDELKAGGGTVDPEQIKQAVNGYLEENPPSGMTAEQEQQLNQNTEDISSLSEEKLNKNQGISNSGKYLVVGADGNITFSDESTDSPEKPLGDYNYSLPDGYKKVDYIDSKGTLHYFLNWTPTVNSRMVQKVIPVEGVNTFIGFAADNNLSFGYQINVSGEKVVTYLGDSFGNSKSEKSFEPDYKQYITVDIANGSQKVEGLEIGTKTSIFDVYESWNNKYPIVGGAFQTWYSSGSVIALTRHKLVRCQIYESEELVYDFVPALRDTDNVCGLYDLVNSTFASGISNSEISESYDYGEIIDDDTGGQNGENAENTHIIVSEMTGDAIQDAINQCKSSGGGVIELLPGGVYICDSPLTIYTDRVDIIGNGAKLDFSGISSDIVCVTLQSSGDISDYSEMIREEYLHYIRGVYFVGSNRTANYEGGRIGTALMFTGTETKISTGYTVDNCVIAGFKTGVDLFTNSWCVKFSNCDISVCDTGIQMISGGQNYGEKFTFTSCTIHSCSVGAVCNHNAGTLQFLGCAMDYNFCAFKTDNQAHIIFTGGHIENNKDKNYFCICSNFGIVLIANSVLHGSQTQYGFASVSEAGKVIMSNCMKESWTMGEDEKDDNGNSKIIYDWINFAS